MRRFAVIAALVAPACAGSDSREDLAIEPTPTTIVTSSPAPTATPVATPVSTPTAAPMPSTISVDATSATVVLPFTAGASGTSSTPHGGVSFANDTGSLVLEGGTLAAALYERQQWDDFGYTLFQGIAIGPTRWDLFWLYCNGSTLAYVWHEGAGGAAMHYVNASGTCSDSATPATANVSLPALTLTVPAPVSGYTITGANVALADGEDGVLRVGEKLLPFVPFEAVDCTACGGPGWYELHSLVWDEDAQSATFVILYLDFAYPDRVYAAYARSLPAFDDPIGKLEIAATWTAAPATSFAPGVGIPRLMPPGRLE